jgi:ankyrin repeat protein
VRRGRKEVTQLLLENRNISVNLQDQDGYTSLHLAVDNSFISVVELLLLSPLVDVNIQAQVSQIICIDINYEFIFSIEASCTEIGCLSMVKCYLCSYLDI